MRASLRTWSLWLCAALCAALPGEAQIPVLTKPPTPAEATPVDPLGRMTPRGTVVGFLQAAQSGRYGEAARYLQLSSSQSESASRLARELKTIMDDGYFTSLDSLSTRPEGSFDDGLPPNLERAGTIHATAPLDLVLVHAQDSQAGQIWLISSETLRLVPQTYRNVSAVWVEQWLPEWMAEREIVGVSIWKWLAVIVLFPVLAGAAWLLIQLLRVPGRIWGRRNGHPVVADTWKSSAKGPAILLLAMVLHRVAISLLGVPVLYRYYYGLVIWISVLLVLAWLAWRLIDRGSRLALQRYHQETLPVATSLLMLGRRILKVLVILVAVGGVLSVLGFEMKTLLAGVGIGGIAVALAAQKTLENVFGGLSLLGDRVMHIGDAITIDGKVGIVEDIGLRSTRLRTLDRAELSVPNGALSQVNLENLSRRDKFFFNPTLLLRMETTTDQLLFVLAEFRRLLYQHSKVERETVRVRLIGFDSSGFRVEFFSYVLTRDFNEFAAIREDLLIRCLQIMEEAGTGMAYPSQTLYLSKDSVADPERSVELQQRAAEVQKRVSEWKEDGNLPFPDFKPEDIERMRGTIVYPPDVSAIRVKDGTT